MLSYLVYKFRITISCGYTDSQLPLKVSYLTLINIATSAMFWLVFNLFFTFNVHILGGSTINKIYILELHLFFFLI